MDFMYYWISDCDCSYTGHCRSLTEGDCVQNKGGVAMSALLAGKKQTTKKACLRPEHPHGMKPSPTLCSRGPEQTFGFRLIFGKKILQFIQFWFFYV